MQRYYNYKNYERNDILFWQRLEAGLEGIEYAEIYTNCVCFISSREEVAEGCYIETVVGFYINRYIIIKFIVYPESYDTTKHKTVVKTYTC